MFLMTSLRDCKSERDMSMTPRWRRIEVMANMVIVLPTMFRALSLSFAPTARAVRMVVPMASPMSTTVTIYIT